MAEIFQAFGVDWRLLFVQAVNFGLLLFVLWYFLYGPLMRLLDERRTKILQGVEDARQAEAALRQIEAARAERLAEVAREADELLAAARASAQQKEQQRAREAEAQARATLEAAEREAAELKAASLEESKREVAGLIVLGIEKGILK